MSIDRRAGLAFICLLGLWLRLPGLWANTFHADEALYATWARLIAIARDPLLTTQLVDKPPLLFYIQALFYPLLATSAGWVARLPNLFFSILLLPLTARLTWQLSGDRGAALWAGFWLALAPLAIGFSATGFIDPLLTFWLVLGLVWVTGRSPRPLAAGVALGLALTAKYQAVLFWPLAIWYAVQAGWTRRQWRRAMVGLALPLLGLLAWEVARSGGFSLWTNQLNSYGGLRLAWSWELAPRLRAWLPLWAGAGAGLLLLLVALVWLGRRSVAPVAPLLLFGLSYAWLHWLLAVPAWDRYVLPVAPLVAVGGGWCLSQLAAWRPASRRWAPLALTGLLLLFALPAALPVRAGAGAVGGRPAADDGAAQVAAQLRAAEWGTVLYDHWYSWQWRYYFLDQPVFVSWQAAPADLAQDLAVHGAGPEARYLALPADGRGAPFLRAALAAGFTAELTYSAPAIHLYRLRPAGEGYE